MSNLPEHRLWCAIIASAVDEYRRYRTKSALVFLQSDGVRLVMDALNLPSDAILAELEKVKNGTDNRGKA